MKIVFDMDNTLTDDFGKSARPGIKKLLTKLRKENHQLILWTNSKKDRAKSILEDHQLVPYFQKFIYREDYDPHNMHLLKDIRLIKADFIIDDDPKQVNFNRAHGKDGFIITPFRENTKPNKKDLDALELAIRKQNSLIRKIFKCLKPKRAH
jgi:hydroxymethylpyrimidine pyrophosphatase-like HAD family hydrolase